ncbi:protein S100-B-like [Cyprinodon tularosa]|uniref:protein S100-B-like n=1 Tax=Cyprinodon tularosa TaxID=77115 RepID=UPI0018E1FFF5|nr:protein S100-B-like [Cyprinodon tularosa]
MRSLRVVNRYSSVSAVRLGEVHSTLLPSPQSHQDPDWKQQLLQMEASKDAASELESGMATIIKVFHKYSGQNCTLRKADLKALINNEMSHFIKKIKDNAILDKLFYDLDQNGDLEIDFKEFIALIAMVTSACHEVFIPSPKQ